MNLIYFVLLKSNYRYLRDNFKLIDPTKICSYGSGYGGYVASILLSEDSKRLFQCISAIAPIVSFQYYSKFINLLKYETLLFDHDLFP